MIHDLILASASPRRRELLSLLGIPFTVYRPVRPEQTTETEPDRIVLQLAAQKAEEAAETYSHHVILSADTLVFCGGHILGKPADEYGARMMLHLLSGNTHSVYTGVCMRDTRTGIVQVETACTQVSFSSWTEEEMERYIRSGEPMDKAGAYAIQGFAGAFVTSIHGSPSNVIGLPLHIVRRMLLNADQIGM